MKRQTKKINVLSYLIPIFFFFAVEVLFRILLNFSLLDSATLRIFFSSVFLVSILEIISLLFKTNKQRNIFIMICLFLVSIYDWGQYGFHNYLGMFISLNTASQASAVTDYIEAFLESFPAESYMLYAPLCIYAIYLIFFKKEKKLNKGKQFGFNLIGIVLGILLWLTTIYIPFFQNPLQLVSNKELVLNPTNSSIAINQFGGITYFFLDFKELILPHQVKVAGNLEEEKDDDALWLEVIKEEQNPTYKKLNSYFIQNKEAQKNDYTGYFKGKNVIVIMMESANYAIDNAEYFPNFTRMLKNSWYWTNHYSPRGTCATADNEFSGLTSLYAISSTCTTNTYLNNTYFKSMFNRFRASGYKTSSFHDYDDTYYQRSIYHYNLGSEKFYNVVDLGIPYVSNGVEWPNDSLMMGQIVNLAKDSSKPFMTFITTVSAHMSYAYKSGEGDKYMNLFEDKGYDEETRRYLSKLKITDDSLGVLLDSLQNEGILDDTVIVMYGDHYPYGLSKEDVSKIVPYDVNLYNDIEKTPFVIYNSKLSAKVFEDKTSYINLLPTLANLFDLDYDARFYMGEDILSKDYVGRVVFNDSSWIDDIAFYDVLNSKITYLGDEIYTTEEIKKINQTIYNKKEMSRLAITTNYFDYLEKALKEREEAQNEETNDRGITSQE